VRYVWVPEGVEPPEIPRGFVVVKRRWVVERTFAWLGHSRRLSKDYEYLSESMDLYCSDSSHVRSLNTKVFLKSF